MHQKKTFLRRPWVAALSMAATAGLLGACGGSSDAAAADAEDTRLQFDPASYTTVNVTVDGVAMKVRQYKVVYVASPIKMAATQSTLTGGTTTLADPYAYQSMVISVPEASAADQAKALYMVVNNGGWWTRPWPPPSPRARRLPAPARPTTSAPRSRPGTWWPTRRRSSA